jgi:hypothetical protein
MKEKEENLTWKQSNPNRNCLTLPRCTACDYRLHRSTEQNEWASRPSAPSPLYSKLG